MQVIWVRMEREYFCKSNWTAQIALIRFNKTAFCRKRRPAGQDSLLAYGRQP
jgi:hypothetical protein